MILVVCDHQRLPLFCCQRLKQFFLLLNLLLTVVSVSRIVNLQSRKLLAFLIALFLFFSGLCQDEDSLLRADDNLRLVDGYRDETSLNIHFLEVHARLLQLFFVLILEQILQLAQQLAHLAALYGRGRGSSGVGICYTLEEAALSLGFLWPSWSDQFLLVSVLSELSITLMHRCWQNCLGLLAGGSSLRESGRKVVETLEVDIVVIERILISAMAMCPRQTLPIRSCMPPLTKIWLRGMHGHHHWCLLAREKNLGLGAHLFYVELKYLQCA